MLSEYTWHLISKFQETLEMVIVFSSRSKYDVISTYETPE